MVGMEITRTTMRNAVASTACRSLLRIGFVLCLGLSAHTAQADNTVDIADVRLSHSKASADVKVSKPRLDLRRPSDPLFGPSWTAPYGQTRSLVQAEVQPEKISKAHQATSQRSPAQFRLVSSRLDRHQVDQGTRMTGWKLGDEVFFGKSKGDLSGVALIWQRSQTDQVSLSGSGLRLTRRIN